MEYILKYLQIIILWVGLLLFSGCTDYQHFTDAHIKFSETEAARMKIESETVIKAAELIVSGFEKESQKETNNLLFTRTVIDSYGNETTEKVYDTSSHLVKFLIVQQRTQALKAILPIIREIFKQKQLKMEAPVTVGAVVKAFIKQIPAMATVGGMYSLGLAGIENAGNYISETITTQTTTDQTTTISNKEK